MPAGDQAATICSDMKVPAPRAVKRLGESIARIVMVDLEAAARDTEVISTMAERAHRIMPPFSGQILISVPPSSSRLQSSLNLVPFADGVASSKMRYTQYI